jgi:ubiquinone/menaquinone biosynthesis C-methylase UbiE
LTEVYQFFGAPGQSVLELGCAGGDLLAALSPTLGVGVDFSEEMISAARQRHPHLRFVHADVHTLSLSEKFDVIILSDLVNDLWDVQAVFSNVSQLTTARRRIIINSYSRLWEPVLGTAPISEGIQAARAWRSAARTTVWSESFIGGLAVFCKDGKSWTSLGAS